MKPRLLLPIIIVVFLFLAAGMAYARTAGYVLPWWTSDSGGGNSTGGNYSLSGTIGQPDAGMLYGGRYQLVGGFWGGVPQPPPRIYLPSLQK